MHPSFRFFRLPNGLKERDDAHLKVARDSVQAAREVLKTNPPPDTFAGRKTQEAFPKFLGLSAEPIALQRRHPQWS